LNRYSIKNYNFILVILIFMLNIIGILTVRSASNGQLNLVEREIAGVCVSAFLMVVISFIPYRKLLDFNILVYIVCLVLLTAVLLIGNSKGMAKRWIVLPVIGQLQPSEFVKIGLIIFFARFLEDHKNDLNTVKTLLITAGPAAAPLVLVFLEPDLSTTIMMFVCVAVMIYVGGLSYKWLLIIFGVGIPLGFLCFELLKAGKMPFIQSYQAERILAKISGNAMSDANLQQTNSIMAIASGMLSGKGLNNNTLASVKNGNFLSEEQTDFIFAVVGEEMGFIGCCAVILLFALLVFECFRTARKALDLEGRIICTGMGALIGFQAFTNIAVATGIFPNTGLPLPFISYGVSSLLSTYVGMGMVLNVALTDFPGTSRRYL